MELLYAISMVIVFIIAIFLSFKTFQFTKTMWKFKNRKKDGSEDDDFKYFD
ncbi:OadG family protein [Malaciobacter molluscorum]|uniref:OadG family protein n=1 Tax=Malaciobacter molluscorum TaxID=1032072 RepID=UPI0013E90F99|nr:OadG family protein [Malaciobacter molluscorum]